MVLEVGHHGFLVVGCHTNVVFDFLHGLGTVLVRHQNASAGGVGAPAFTSANVPSVADHELEVIVVIDRSGDVAVVLDELSRSNLPGDNKDRISNLPQDGQDLQHRQTERKRETG